MITTELRNQAEVGALLNKKREMAQHYDEMCTLERAQTDREYKRFFKQEARDSLKLLRGMRLLTGLLLCGEKDSPYVPESKWPEELRPYANLAYALSGLA